MGSSDPPEGSTESATIDDRPPRASKATVADKPPPTDAPTVADKPRAHQERQATSSASVGSSLTLSNAAEAMHLEEVRRSRQFIALGWVASIAAMGVVPLVDAPRWMDIAFIASLAWGIVVSFYFHQRFKDPSKFSAQQMLRLGVFVAINAHVIIAYFGILSAGPVIAVLGIHFVARGESARELPYMFMVCVICYAAAAAVVIAGVVPDPGVFASEEPLPHLTLIAGAVFVLGIYALAYYLGRAMRRASLRSIEGLHQQTRLAAQRKALMDELRADLERALRVGGPGRYTGQTFGAFMLSDVLGRGAMGEVYEAHHVTTNEPAAVKLLRRELLADPTHVARFLREAKASGALASPYVVRILDAAADDAGTPYLAMERLHGQTLAEMLRREGRIAPAEVVELCAQAGAGIDAAAAAGTVHRDLKPQNLFRAQLSDGVEQWKLLDFGVATLVDDSGTLTQGGIVGTPSYMAPEQAQGLRVDARADVYALAAIAYRCFTGRHPFTGPDTPSLLYAVVHRMPLRPTALGAFDPDLDRWVALALAKNPEERIETGKLLADALAGAFDGKLDPKLRKRADALIRRHGWGEA